MTLEEQLAYIQMHFPEAWDYLHSKHDVRLPKFDDNDEVVHYWGGTLPAEKEEEKCVCS